jgi:hypothetical protein
MKTKTAPAKTNEKINTQNTKHEELKTDYPLSEKDEVKQAEKRLSKSIRYHL